MRTKENLIDRRKVRAWMVMNNIRAKDIQESLGYKKHAPVTDTLRGATDNRRVLRWLIDHGCPRKDINIPKKLQGKL